MTSSSPEAATLPIARGAFFQAAVKMYPGEVIELRQGARVVERSEGDDA